MEIGEDNELVLTIIRLGVQAGGLRLMSKHEPAAAHDLEDRADTKSRLAALLMEDLGTATEGAAVPLARGQTHTTGLGGDQWVRKLR